jgi:hypothetical protein
MVSMVESRLLDIMKNSKPYTTDPKDIKVECYLLLFQELTPKVLAGSPFETVMAEWNRSQGSAEFYTEKLEALTAIKKDIDLLFSETLSFYQKALKDWLIANRQLDQMLKSEKTSEKTLEAQKEVVSGLEKIKVEKYSDFLSAKRLETYFRVLPSIYEDDSIVSTLDGISWFARMSMAYKQDAELLEIVCKFYSFHYMK